jgi:hypothetical protein
MIAFSVGDRVIIRYGEHQGQKGRITGTQAAAVYEVAMAGGFVLFFCAGGLEKDESREGSPRGHSVHPSEPCISARKRGGRLSLGETSAKPRFRSGPLRSSSTPRT